jgi:hypothetical protein
MNSQPNEPLHGIVIIAGEGIDAGQLVSAVSLVPCDSLLLPQAAPDSRLATAIKPSKQTNLRMHP